MIIDGTGNAPFSADIGIGDDKICAIGDLSNVVATDAVDASSLVTCPGFIDIHTHSDVSLLCDPEAESKVLQGVTTEVTGNCSISAFPLAPARLQLHHDLLAGHGYDEVDLTWQDLDGYASAIAASRPAVNVAPLVGHGAIRIAAMGVEQRAATSDELNEMKRLLDLCLEQGAFGFTTGLTAVPSAYGNFHEVAELVHIVAASDALYATHARSPVGEGFPEVVEAIRTTAETGVRLQFSHAAINEPSKWGRAPDYVRLFEEAQRRGLDVRFDVYPYDASSSPMTQYLPLWVQAGGIPAMRDRLRDPELRRRAERDLSKGWVGGIPWLWDRVVVSSNHPKHDWCTGKSMADAAEIADLSPEELTLDLCLEYGNSIRVIMHYRTESDMLAFLAHELSVVGSDGIALPLHQGPHKPHPRFYGTYPKILGRYVRDKTVLGLAEAIRKMTGSVADRLQIRDRGIILKDTFADLTVFDPMTITDTSTYMNPSQPPIGVRDVIVNGQVVVRDGRQTVSRPGRVLRRS